MKNLPPSLLCLLSIAGCSRESAKQTPGHASIIHTIQVGKGPDAIFLTPDESYVYVANVEDTLHKRD